MTGHDGHVACHRSGTSTGVCVAVAGGRLVVRACPSTVGWWPDGPGDLRAVAALLVDVADQIDAAAGPAVDGQLELPL